LRTSLTKLLILANSWKAVFSFAGNLNTIVQEDTPEDDVLKARGSKLTLGCLPSQRKFLATHPATTANTHNYSYFYLSGFSINIQS